MPLKPNYNILGIGAPVMDHLITIDEAFLGVIPGENYGAELMDYPDLLDLIGKCHSKPVLSPGGSCANAIKGLSQLGNKCAMLGKIGKDNAGFKLETHMRELGVSTLFKRCETPTAHVACFITPDGKRTMRGYMGASQLLSQYDLEPQFFENVKLVHLGGYTLLTDNLTETAMKMAKEAGALVSFDLGSFEVTKTHRERIYSLLQYVDILFGNRDEMHALTLDDLEGACDTLKKKCVYVVIMLAEKGCLICHDKGKLYFEGYPVVHPIDTTGAGDLFASGFLHGILNNRSIEDCVRYGSITGSAIVKVIGTELSRETWDQLKNEI